MSAAPNVAFALGRPIPSFASGLPARERRGLRPKRISSCVPVLLLLASLAFGPVSAVPRVAGASGNGSVPAPGVEGWSWDRLEAGLEAALARAGANRPEIENALLKAPNSQREGMAFLVRYMPEQDLRSLSAAQLLEETDLAYRAWSEAPWGAEIPREVFLNDVLPYAVVSEVRTPWRRFLRARVAPLVVGARTPGDAAVRLNQQIYRQFGVRYSQERSRTDQNAMQVIAEQKATCTGLSVLLVDACRSVGVPARLVGTPLWADSSGNHSWVEVWDHGWHFTGAAEPTEDRLDEGWFVDAASRAIPGVPIHSIYATSWAETGTAFPLAWDEDGSLGYVHAVDVTERYAGASPTPEGRARVEFVVRNGSGRRVPTVLTVREPQGERSPLFVGRTKDDTADGNDHLAVLLDEGHEYVVEFVGTRGTVARRFRARDDTLLSLPWETDPTGSSGDRGRGADSWGRPIR